MKKILVLLFCTISMCMYAGGWQEYMRKGDPMLNEAKSYTAIVYMDDQGQSFTMWDIHPDQYRLQCDRIFDFDIDRAVFVKVGLYDNNDNLIEMFDMYLFLYSSGNYGAIETSRRGPLTRPVGQNKKVAKIMNHINSCNGYVRFLAPIYNGKDFDLRVPCRTADDKDGF